jgi:hypothetical protein
MSKNWILTSLEKHHDKLSDTEKQAMREYMIETSEKPKHLPKRFFHATALANHDSIMEQGLLPHSVYGEIYFCRKEKQCLKFVEKPCIVYSVKVEKLDPNYIFLSGDHNKKLANFEAFTYYKKIEPHLLKWRVIK